MRHIIYMIMGIAVFALCFFLAFASGADGADKAKTDPFEVAVPLSDGSGRSSGIDKAKRILQRYSINDQNIQEIEEYLNEVENYETEIEKEIGDIP